MAKNRKEKKNYDDNLSEEFESNIIDVDGLFTRPLRCVDNEGFTEDKRCPNEGKYLGFCSKHRLDLTQHAGSCKAMCIKLAKLPFLDKIHFMAYICEYILEYIDIFHSHQKFLDGFISKFKTDFKTMKTKKDLTNYKQLVDRYKDYKDQFDDLLEMIKEEEENDDGKKKKDKKKSDKEPEKKKHPKKEKIDKLVSELKKYRKLFRGTYGRVAKTTSKYWEILNDIVSLDPNFSGKPRFELSLEQLQLVKNKSTEHPIAIKGCQHFIIGNELQETSTLRERVLLTNYKHNNIVKVLFFHEGEKELVYPMLNGGISLESYIKQTQLKERMKNFDYIFYQIIKAVKYLHDNGILHGDLKAKNILINRDSKEITLIDFGACSYQHSEGFARTLCTYYVSSPEDLASGKKNGKSTKASDVWAIGMNMIHYLHGEDIIDLLEIDTEDLQDLFKRLQIDNQGFDYPLPNESKRKLQLGKPPRVRVEAKYRKLFLPLLMFDPSKRPDLEELINNPIFKPFTEKKEESEVIDELDTTMEIEFDEKKEEKKDEEIEETCEQDSYMLVRSDLIMNLYNVLKSYNGLYCMVHIVRVMDKYVETVKKSKNSQFTVNDLFKDKNTSKLILMAITILMTSLLVQWRDLFTVEQLEDILDIENPDEIIARITDVLTILKYNLYEKTFDLDLKEKVNYEKLREVLKTEKFFELNKEEQLKLYNEFNKT